MNVETWLSDIREYVRNGDLGTIQHLYEQIIAANDEEDSNARDARDASTTRDACNAREYKYNLEYLWQKTFLMAITYKQTHIKQWLEDMFQHFDLLDQIALKPTLTYGKYLTK